MALNAAPVENAGTCQHDPLAPCCTLVVESSWMGQRIRCFICEKVNDLSRKGRFDKTGGFPPPQTDKP